MSRQASRQAPVEPPVQIGDYRLEKVIGQGTYGKVRLGIHLESGENVAIKVIEKAQIQSPKQVARLQREIRFLKLLHHPHIVKVVDVIETQDFIYIIMEYAVGGELFDYIVANKRVKEKEARSFFRMVLSAVDYCHQVTVSCSTLTGQNAIIHRDLKPGVILFALLCGHLPFDDDNMKELYKKIANGTYKTPDHLPSGTLPLFIAGARHLIGRLITVDPKKRATLKEVLQHPWVNEGYDSPPQSYIPKRVAIHDPAALSKDITNRLEIFGYTKEDIRDAFSPGQDHGKPNAIRSTYHLLSEMVIREQARLRSQRKLSQQKLVATRSTFNSANTLASTDLSSSSTSQHSLQRDMDTLMTSESTPSPPQFAPPPPPLQSNAGYTRSEVSRRAPQPRAVSYHQGNITDQHVSYSQPESFLAFSRDPVPSRESVSTIRNTTPTMHGHRRQSVPLMIPNPSKPSPTEKFKEELRAVSGWFLNFSTTTSKSQQDILGQLFAILGEQMVVWSTDGRCMFQCEVDMSAMHHLTDVGAERIASGSGSTKPQMVGFQVEISKVPRMNLNAIHFKRLSGGVWNYKKVCNKILSKVSL
ncbi:hypothetical protein HDU91_004363 [Kappamyces sp. JEL0680]|nr:hypothetical protein HDU91_004363 [Kappamyces sp. JEL0680]